MNIAAVLWLALGLFMVGMEIIVPGFVLFWFGIGGILTALAAWLNILKDPISQSIFFFLSSLVFVSIYFGFLKKYFKKSSSHDDRDPTLTELSGKCTSPIAPGKPGRVKLNKAFHSITEWGAESADTIEAGEEITVVEADGVSLIVKKSVK